MHHLTIQRVCPNLYLPFLLAYLNFQIPRRLHSIARRKDCFVIAQLRLLHMLKQRNVHFCSMRHSRRCKMLLLDRILSIVSLDSIDCF